MRVGGRARELCGSLGITAIRFYPILGEVKLLAHEIPEALSLQVVFPLGPSLSSLSFILLTYSGFCLSQANINKHQFVPFLQWLKKTKTTAQNQPKIILSLAWCVVSNVTLFKDPLKNRLNTSPFPLYTPFNYIIHSPSFFYQSLVLLLLLRFF